MGMFIYFLSRILGFCLFAILASQSSVQAYSTKSSDKMAALEVVRNYALFINSGNQHLLETMSKCLDHPETKFLLKTKSMMGQDVSEERTCHELLSSTFGWKDSEPFVMRRNFRIMQYHAILAQSGGTLNSDGQETEVLDGDIDKKLPSFEHPVRGTLDHVMSKISKMPAPEKIVWAKAYTDYQKSIHDQCQSFVKENQQVIQLHLGKPRDLEIKKNLCFYLTKKKNNLSFAQSIRLGVVWNAYLFFSKRKREEWRKKHEQKYFEKISEHPHFLLFSTIKPSISEIRSILRRMKEFQQDALAELASLKGSQLLKLSPMIEQSPELLNSLVSTKLHSSRAETESLFEDLNLEYQKQVSRQTKIEFTALVAAIGICYILPVGRLKFFSRSACLLSVGLPVDLLMLFNSVHARNKALREFSKSPEMEYILNDSSKLTETNRDVLFNILFLPLSLPFDQIAPLAKRLIR